MTEQTEPKLHVIQISIIGLLDLPMSDDIGRQFDGFLAIVNEAFRTTFPGFVPAHPPFQVHWSEAPLPKERS